MTRMVGRHAKGAWARRRVTVSRGEPWHPQLRHHGSGVVTWQRISAFASVMFWPIAVRPKPSRRVKVVRSGAVKVGLSNVEVFRECLCGNFHSSRRPRLFLGFRHARDPGCWVQLATLLFLKSPFGARGDRQPASVARRAGTIYHGESVNRE